MRKRPLSGIKMIVPVAPDVPPKFAWALPQKPATGRTALPS